MRGVRMSRKGQFEPQINADSLCGIRGSDYKAQAAQGAIEIFEVERLPEVAIAAGFERRRFHPRNVKGSYGDDRDLLARAFEFAQLADCLQPVEHRHVQIDNDETGTKAPRNVQR